LRLSLRLAGALALLAAVPFTAASTRPTSLAAAAVAPPDTTRPAVEVELRFQPAALYSASRGFGIGGGVGITNLGWAGSEVELAARLSQRFQSASAYLYTQDPYEASLYGLVGGRVRTSSVQRFYGLGPEADRDDRLELDFTSAAVEGRVGWYPFGHTGLLVQPGVQLQWDHLSSFEDADDDPTTFPDEASIASLEAVEGEIRSGVFAGLEVSHDTRDRLVMTRRGILAEAAFHRFFSLDDVDPEGLQFNRFQARLFGFQPLMGRRVVLFGRAVAAVTRADDDPTGERLPFFYRPVLDGDLLSGYTGDRFFGRDLLAFGGGVRFPLVDLFGRYGIDGALVADLGSSYHDIADQFSPSVSFERDVTADEDGNFPLRPGAGFGISLVNLDRERDVAAILIGVSPEGVTLTGFQIVYDFRDLLPLFR
jgi:hypothetical protein